MIETNIYSDKNHEVMLGPLHKFVEKKVV
jgi:hypothetical protein